MGTNDNPINNRDLTIIKEGVGSSSGDQQSLFHVERQVEIEDVEMGVLDSGIPYLTGRGLERMCGLGHGPFIRLTGNWADEKNKPRGQLIQKLLEENGYFEEDLFLKAEFNGRVIHAFTEPVCLAFLEYYAFVTGEPRPQAIKAFRTLAKLKFRDYVYQATGYNPESKILDSWKYFHDRVDLTHNAVPDGYFGIFGEIASIVVPMIRNGIIISDNVVPDISVGLAWSNHWKNGNLESKYGERVRYSHNYPEYYAQAQSNPQAPFAYPNSCLGEFRQWLKDTYISKKLPSYLLGQTKKGLAEKTANNILATFTLPQLK